MSTKIFFPNSNNDVSWAGDRLHDIRNGNGELIGIQATDTYQVSYVVNGNTYTYSGTVGEELLAINQRLGNILQPLIDNNVAEFKQIQADGKVRDVKNKHGQDVYTASRDIYGTVSVKGDAATQGLAIISGKAGVESQLSGFTISFTDAQGNAKKSANAALEFKLLQRAENKTGDNSLTFQVGSEANVAIKVALTDMRAEALGLQGNNGQKLLFVPKENANAAINVFENALTMALDQSTSIGAVQQRLEYTQANLTTSSENVQAAESTIRDADMAKEMTEFTKNSVLTQSAQAMLAQANQTSSSVISLLQ